MRRVKRTRVIHMTCALEAHYSLPPEEAVVAAHAQLTRQDYNWWEYDKYRKLVRKGKSTVGCGDWVATLGNGFRFPPDRRKDTLETRSAKRRAKLREAAQARGRALYERRGNSGSSGAF